MRRNKLTNRKNKGGTAFWKKAKNKGLPHQGPYEFRVRPHEIPIKETSKRRDPGIRKEEKA